MQRKRLETAQIKIERRILFVVRSTRFLKLAIRLGPALLPIQHNAIPERIPSRHQFARSICGEGQRLINFMALLRVHTAEKIDRACDDCSTSKLERARTDQDFRTIKAIGDAKAPRQLDRLAQDENVPLLVRRRCDHRARAYPDMRSGGDILAVTAARTLRKSAREIE